MSVNANRKGKRGERDFCEKILRPMGFECRRAQQYQGVTEDSQDIVHDVHPLLRIEVKYGYDNLELWSKQVQGWITKCEEEAKANGQAEIAIAWRKTRRPWTIIYPALGPVYVQGTDCQQIIKVLLRRCITLELSKKHEHV